MIHLSLAMSVFEKYRGQGIGTIIIATVIVNGKIFWIFKNFAYLFRKIIMHSKMYKKAGYLVVDENSE